MDVVAKAFHDIELLRLFDICYFAVQPLERGLRKYFDIVVQIYCIEASDPFAFKHFPPAIFSIFSNFEHLIHHALAHFLARPNKKSS